jgi:tetratricopeptide (TPR) repeat protein
LAVYAAGLATCAIALGTPAKAALNGQPPAPKAAADKIRVASADLLRGNIATARPNLLLLVEANAATADLTDLLARAIGDDTTYNGVAATLEEAANTAPSDTTRAYVTYNLARLHLLRSRLLSARIPRRAPLEAASLAAGRLDANLRDPAAWELKGDIASERGDVSGAVAAYQKIVGAGGGSGFALYKQGLAYARASRTSQAQSTLEAALRVENRTGSGGPALKYNLYQDLAGVYLMQGNDTAALTAFSQSTRLKPDGTPGFRYRTDVARRLLPRGKAAAAAVLAYAEAALRGAPDDFELQALRDDARRAR